MKVKFEFLKTKLPTLLFFLIFGLSVQVHAQLRTLSGTVTDSQGEPLPGATVTIEGTTRGASADMDGSFSIDVNSGENLVISFIGYDKMVIPITDQTELQVQLQETTEKLEELTVVAFGKQKKESVIASISTVKTQELKVPSSNLTTALAGRMSGLISYQRSGEPGEDNADFFIRGVTSFTYARGPLILIDGVEMTSRDLSNLQVDDIASFSIMKDAAATALYGARGGNGVILVTTKEGKEGKAKISLRVENSISMPTFNVDIADPITYMKLNNEAVSTRDPLQSIPYSREKIGNTERETNPLIYPATDWQSILFKDFTSNQRANFNVSGGGKVARYYIAGSVTSDQGILKVEGDNDFNSNIDLKKYLLRSNVNVDITPTTEAVVRLHGTFDDYTGPIDGGADLYRKVMRTDPVRFPPFYPHTEDTEYIQHILFGNYDDASYINPYADMVRGYKDYSRSVMMAQFELFQELDFVTQGLKLRGLFSIRRNAYFDISRSYNPYYYTATGYDKYEDTYQLVNLNPTGGTEYLGYSEGQKSVSAKTYGELALNYDRTFLDKHAVSGLLVAITNNVLSGNAGSLQLSLPARNLGVSGRFTYAYDSRYFTEFNFGYNGSERFAEDERWGFFPSAGLGWIITNENFWTGRLSEIITNLKLKGTYGIVGNDAIGTASDRFFYLSEVDMNQGSRRATFGENFGYSRSGIGMNRYANDKITWEVSQKLNLGIELGLFDNWDLIVDVYNEYKKNILMRRVNIPTTMGLQAIPESNVGEASGQGLDMSLDYNQFFTNDFWISGRANFTYATARFEAYESVDNTETPWLERVGQPVSQQWGYVAERLFVDENEVNNSPVQTFGEYAGGDIKYRDINNDGNITALDMVPIGFPTRPEIIYGFGLSLGYKGFDFSAFFQGLARESFWMDARATSPFAVLESGAKNALMQVYADNHWSETDRDLYALWPRLAPRVIDNNTQRSTWFMRDGTFLRLKSLEIGYSLPKNIIQTIKVEQFRIYLSGTNLLTFSKFKLWDPEMAGNGLGYPIQKVFNAGVQISF